MNNQANINNSAYQLFGLIFTAAIFAVGLPQTSVFGRLTAAGFIGTTVLGTATLTMMIGAYEAGPYPYDYKKTIALGYNLSATLTTILWVLSSGVMATGEVWQNSAMGIFECMVNLVFFIFLYIVVFVMVFKYCAHRSTNTPDGMSADDATTHESSA